MRPRASLPIIVLDRDGTLIREGGYLDDPAKVRLLAGVPEGLRQLKQAGYKIVVLSNQSGVGRGLFPLSDMRRVHQRFKQLLTQKGIRLDGYYWCVHRPEAACACRKPKLGMLRQAARRLHRPWRGAVSVGDRPSDIQVGQSAGGRGILMLTGYGRRWVSRKDVRPDYVARNFRSAVRWILRSEKEETL